jgi:hypothetical protein
LTLFCIEFHAVMPNTAKHYATYENMSLGSNGVD